MRHASDDGSAPSRPAADVTLERDGDTAILTMTNPGRRNCFSSESRIKLVQLLEELAKDSAIRAIILTGGDGHFCAGADIANARRSQQTRDPLAIRQRSKESLGLLRAIAGNPKPIIAAVEGDAFGGGLALAAASDIVVATRTARFGTAFTALGLLPDLGLLYTLQQRVGAARAKRMMMLSERISGEEAHRIGFVDDLVDPAQLLERASAWAARFTAVAPIAVALTKESIAQGVHSIDEVARLETSFAPLLLATADAAEGMKAFTEKRTPRFESR